MIALSRMQQLQWLLDRDGRMGWDADFGEIDLWSHCVVTGPGSRPDGAAPSASLLSIFRAGLHAWKECYKPCLSLDDFLVGVISQGSDARLII